jgi:hypothetical protein
MARKFNPLAAHGTITPPERGAVYYQDGGYFNSSGDLVFEDRPATPPKKVVSEVTEIDGESGEVKTQKVETLVEQIEPGDPKVALKLWLEGKADVKFQTVRSLVKKGFGVALATKSEIIDYLVNTANLVPAELVKV